MKLDSIKDQWKLACDRIRCTWGKLSEEDIAGIAGNREQLTLLLQTRYGYAKSVADGKVTEFAEGLR